MGSSGAGKTTLLNVMANRIKPKVGQIFLDGVPFTEIHDIQRRIAYVMQDDIMMATLTVLLFHENGALEGMCAACAA